MACDKRVNGFSVDHLLQFLTTSFGGIRFAIRPLRVTPYRVESSFDELFRSSIGQLECAVDVSIKFYSLDQ